MCGTAYIAYRAADLCTFFVRKRFLSGIPDGKALFELRSDIGVVGLFFDFLMFLLMNHNELFAFAIMIFKILADCNT